MGLIKLQISFHFGAFLVRKKAAKNLNVLSGRVVIVDVDEADQVNCSCSTNIDFCDINFSLTRIP